MAPAFGVPLCYEIVPVTRVMFDHLTLKMFLIQSN